MKKYYKLLLFVIFTSFQMSYAQKVDIITSQKMDWVTMEYLGSNSQYNCFFAAKEGKKYFVTTTKNDLSLVSSEEITFKIKDEKFEGVFMDDSSFYYLTYVGLIEMGSYGYPINSSTVSEINLYKYNIDNKKLIKTLNIHLKEKIGYYSDFLKLFTKNKIIIIIDNQPYDFNFNKTDINFYSKDHSKSSFLSQSPLFKDDQSLNKIKYVTFEKKVEDDFKIFHEYTETTDLSVYSYQKTISNIKLKSYFGYNNNIEFDISKNRKIIDFNFFLTNQKNIAILGKYIENKNDSFYYGFYTALCDSNLNYKNDLVYTEMFAVNKKNRRTTFI